MNNRKSPGWAYGQYVVFLFLLLCSCKADHRKETVMLVVTEWTGKKIFFPEGIPCQFLGRDTVCINPNNPTKYKVLLYVDSTGCSGCKMKLFEWKKLIDDVDSLLSDEIDFLFFVQPQKSNLKELNWTIRENNFQYPIFMDIENEINKINNFPSEQIFQCFLLDKDNKVVLIGNPTINPQIWELYKQQISGVKRTTNPLTTIQVNPSRQDLPKMKVGETYSCVFEIENTGSYPFVILGIRSSCGCAVPTWDRQPVAPGRKTEIKVEVKPESTGFFNKTIDVYGNIELSVVKLSVIGTVE